MTGETGAGKSVLIGSIESALGKKISKDMIRPGAKEAVIELLFWIDDKKLIKEIEAFDLEVEDGQIFIKRVINEKRSIKKIVRPAWTAGTSGAFEREESFEYDGSFSAGRSRKIEGTV